MIPELPESEGLSYVKTSLEVIPGQYVVLLKGDFGYVKSAGMSYMETQLAMAGITKNLLYTGGLATMSGTSMSAPHACGVLLSTGGNPKTSGYVINDPDGNPDPIIHK